MRKVEYFFSLKKKYKKITVLNKLNIYIDSPLLYITLNELHVYNSILSQEIHMHHSKVSEKGMLLFFTF